MDGVAPLVAGPPRAGQRRRSSSLVVEEANAIRVAVRLRPFSRREQQAGARRIVEMDGDCATITDPTSFLLLEGPAGSAGSGDGLGPGGPSSLLSSSTSTSTSLTAMGSSSSSSTSSPSEDDEAHVWRTRFTFDRCFWSFDKSSGSSSGSGSGSGMEGSGASRYASQADIFDTYGPWIIENAVKGFNCSLFAYGQTGSGKTHTMMGGDVDITASGDAGFIPRLCSGLFEQIRATEREAQAHAAALAAAAPEQPRGAVSSSSFHVEASYFEIYNERVFDLLNCKNKTEAPTSLRVREHPKTGAYVEDLLTIAVSAYHEIEELLKQGAATRRVAETQMNKESSRSHAVFQLVLRNSRRQADGKCVEQASRLYFVDLAGSERVSASGATGARLKEAANINRSLSALSDVIKALTAPRPAGLESSSASGSPSGGTAGVGAGKPGPGTPKQFVPYRNSSLTWLLKESLGGNAKTVMLATLSPDASNYQETLSTLKYAERAKKIVNKARVNKESNAALVETLHMEVQALREQLFKYESGAAAASAAAEAEAEAEVRRPASAVPGRFLAHQASKEELMVRLKSQEKLVHQLSTSWEEKRHYAQSHFHFDELEDKLEGEEKGQSEGQGLSGGEGAHGGGVVEAPRGAEERRRAERQARHKAQMEQELQRRKTEQTKYQQLQRQLDECRAQVVELTASMGAIEAGAREEAARHKNAFAKEQQKRARREKRLAALYRLILDKASADSKDQDEGDNRDEELEEGKEEVAEEGASESSPAGESGKRTAPAIDAEQVLRAHFAHVQDVEPILRALKRRDDKSPAEPAISWFAQQLADGAPVPQARAKALADGVDAETREASKAAEAKEKEKEAEKKSAEAAKAAAEALARAVADKECVEAKFEAFRAHVESITRDIGAKQDTIAELTVEVERGLARAGAQDAETQRLRGALAEAERWREELELSRAAQLERESEVEELEEQLASQQQTSDIERRDMQLRVAALQHEAEARAAEAAEAKAEAKADAGAREARRTELEQLKDEVEEERAQCVADLQAKAAECEQWRYSEMEAVKARSRLELELVTERDQVTFLKEREAALQGKLNELGNQHLDVRRKFNEQELSAQREVDRLARELEDSKREASSLGQQVENERTTFDSIFQAQAEVLSYSTFGAAPQAAAVAPPGPPLQQPKDSKDSKGGDVDAKKDLRRRKRSLDLLSKAKASQMND